MHLVHKGEIKYYREFEDVLKVEVTDLDIIKSHSVLGVSYTLRVLEVLQTTSRCYAPAIGFTFSVWEPVSSRNKSGIHLSDKL